MKPILQYELKYYFNNKKELIVISILFVSFFMLLPFSLKYQVKQLTAYAGSLLWLAMLTCHSLIGASLYERDRLSGRLDYYPLLPMPLEYVILAKWLAHYLAATLPMLAISPLIVLFAEPAALEWGRIALSILAGSAALSVIMHLSSALLAGIGQGAGAILGLLALPLIIPVIIFGSIYTQQGEPLYLFVILGFVGLLAPVMALCAASCIRHSA